MTDENIKNGNGWRQRKMERVISMNVAVADPERVGGDQDSANLADSQSSPSYRPWP